jgi:hypothetical protein
MITTTGTTHPASLRARLAPLALTAGAVALVTVGLIEPADHRSVDTAPAEVRVVLVDRPVGIESTTGDRDAPEPVPPPTPSTSPASPAVPAPDVVVVTVPKASVASTTVATPAAVPPSIEVTPAVSAITLAPLTLVRWVAGAVASGDPVGPADDAAIRTTTRQAWTSGLAARRAPGNTTVVASARSTRSGPATVAFESDLSALVVNGHRAVADPARPSSQTIVDIALIEGDRALVTACTLDTDRVVDTDGTAVPGGTGVIREIVRLGLVRADGGWLLDDLHVVHRTVTDPTVGPPATEVPPAC